MTNPRIEIDALRDEALRQRGLPPVCYRYEPEIGIAVIQRGVDGYAVPTNAPTDLTPEQQRRYVEAQNAALKVTPAQAEAMFVGSAFGWTAPLADPRKFS